MTNHTFIKLIFIAAISLVLGFLGFHMGFSSHQALAISVFAFSIIGVLLLWELRLSFVFIGTGALLITKTIDLENLLKFASLDVILFLIGMMILVAMLKESGFFYWLITKLLTIKNISGAKLFFILMSVSAFLSGLMGEVASIIIMAKVILDITDFLDIDPVPLIISTVLATNIGSAGTVVGNPIGVLIAARGGLGFEDFLLNALPITIVSLMVTLVLLIVWYRKYIKTLTEKLKPIHENTFFLSLISIPIDKKTKGGVTIFTLAIILMALHKRIENILGISENTLLLMTPLIFAGIVMVYYKDKVRDYIEKDVEWMSLLFFMFLFAEAGVIKSAGIADFFATKIVEVFKSSNILTGMILYSSGVLSSILDNTVAVTAFVPIIQSLESISASFKPLWWAVLFGACFGGNITAVGSTANIMALDILEKKSKIKIGFLRWLKVGLLVGIISMVMAHFMIILMSKLFG